MPKSVSSEGAGGRLCGHHPIRTLTGPHWLRAPFLSKVVRTGAGKGWGR